MQEFEVCVGQHGLAIGQLYVLTEKNDIDEPVLSSDEGIRILQAAYKDLAVKLEKSITDQTSNASEILEAELMLLEDEGLKNSILEQITAGIQVLQAIRETCSKYEKRLLDSDSEYLRERAEDIRGIGKALSLTIQKKNMSLQLPEGDLILMAEELTALDIVDVPIERICGLISKRGSALGHISIMAAGLGIPYVYGAAIDIDGGCEVTAAIDTEHSRIYFDPDETTIEDILRRNKKIKEDKAEMRKLSEQAKPSILAYANIDSVSELDLLKNSLADGVGLVRTELLFMNMPDRPTEEEQLEVYKQIIEAAKDKAVVLRAFDIGSDKQVEWLSLSRENNPALGCRGIRTMLSNPDIFKTQLRAFMRSACYGDLRILFPMITAVSEIHQIKDTINQVALELQTENLEYRMPMLGAMIETPAAAVIADKIADEVDFFSIGSNDLTQYTLAVDRADIHKQDCQKESLEAVFFLIEKTIEAAHMKSIKVCLCGDMATDAECVGKLINMGIDSMSVPLSCIDKLRIMGNV